MSVLKVEPWARPGTRSRLLSPAQVEEIAQLYESGLSMAQIAERFPCSWQTIQRALARHGVKRRRQRYGLMASHWKGGRTLMTEGYVEIVLPPDHQMRCMLNNSKRVLEHRIVMAEHIGRPLTSKETVHHINGNRADNRIENLQLVSGQGHSRYQRAKCGACGSRHIIYEELPPSQSI